MKTSLGIRRRYNLALKLLAAIGIPSAGAALSGGCGGVVTIEGSGGSSGSEASSTQTSSSSQSGGGGFVCNVAEMPQGGELVYGCFPPSPEGCPDAGDTIYAFNELHAKECTDPDECWCHDAACGCYTQTFEVPCGPELIAGQCCYYALIAPSDSYCEGRPFMVAGEARRAQVRLRSDWLRADAAAADASDPALDAQLAQQLAFAWLDDARNEHASVASFARFVLELLSVAAPAELVSAASQAALDEIRHAQLCFSLASRYAQKTLGPAELPLDGSLEQRRSLRDITVATVVEGCVNETLAALCAGAASEAAGDPQARAALREIADDEERHAALAWRFVAWACSQGDDAEQAALRRAVDTAFDDAIAAAYRAAEDDGDRVCRQAQPSQQLLSYHGQLAPAQQRALLRAGLREVVQPCRRTMELKHRSPSTSRRPAVASRATAPLP